MNQQINVQPISIDRLMTASDAQLEVMIKLADKIMLSDSLEGDTLSQLARNAAMVHAEKKARELVPIIINELKGLSVEALTTLRQCATLQNKDTSITDYSTIRRNMFLIELSTEELKTR